MGIATFIQKWQPFEQKEKDFFIGKYDKYQNVSNSQFPAHLGYLERNICAFVPFEQINHFLKEKRQKTYGKLKHFQFSISSTFRMLGFQRNASNRG